MRVHWLTAAGFLQHPCWPPCCAPAGPGFCAGPKRADRRLPPPGVQPSVPDLAAQVAFQRAFEAVVWAMPASAIYRLRVGLTEVPGMADNVILAYSVPLRPKDEAITPNRALIPSPSGRGGLSSFEKDRMKVNADGSVDLYFGPNAPDGDEANWIPTEGKTPYVWFRLYGPDEAFWNRSFKMPDPELVDQNR